jgi:hypothetical protein
MTDPTLTETETRALAILADMIIPASDAYGVPSAGDPAIVAGILNDAQRHHARLSDGLGALEELAQGQHSTAFANLDPAQREGVVATFREAKSGVADLIASLTVQAYYRDDRVMTSLDMELRPPHPKGYEVAQGDWSLLDPVRQKDAFFRETD